MPKLCDKLKKLLKPWREEDVPVLSWSEYRNRVKEKYPEMEEIEETLRFVTKYLHLMGEVSYFKIFLS